MPVIKGFSKILVIGAPTVGKTSIIEQVVYGNYFAEKVMYPTIEDTYDAWIDADRGQKERIRIFDLKGLDEEQPVLPLHHIQVVDGIVLVFSITSKKSFNLVEQLKKDVDRVRGKEFPMVVLGTKVDLNQSRECDHSEIIRWAHSEKVKLFEVLPMNRNTLQEPMAYLVKKIITYIARPNRDAGRIFRRVPGRSSAKDSTVD